MSPLSELNDVLKDLHDSAVLALQESETHTMKLRLVLTYRDKLLERRKKAGPDVRLKIDSHMRNFFAGFGNTTLEMRVRTFNHDDLRMWYIERLALLDLVCKGHDSPHLNREAKDICRAIIRACDNELAPAPPTRLGKTRLRLVR